MTFNVRLTHNLELGFSTSNFENAVSQEWDGWLTWNERDVSRLQCWTHVVTFNVHPNHDLDLAFSRSNYSVAIDRNTRAHRHRMKTIWVDSLLYLLCGLQLWPWPWIFKVKIWKCCISGMGVLIDMERKGCESTGCYTHIVTSNFDPTYDIDLGFSR